jgi:hypothetical protein
MHYEARKVVAHRYTRRGPKAYLSVITLPLTCTTVIPRMEPGEGPISERLLIVDAHQLHEHIRDQDPQVLGIARFVQERHNLQARILGPRPFGWRGGHLQDGAGFWRHSVLLDHRLRALRGSSAALALRMLSRRD